jgi:sulfatase maturation enzyme AslB (radical SAM superfamily)
VSNGFDLAHYTALLKTFGVVKVQVTFDGPKEYHNRWRIAVDGRGTSFDRIVSGIEAALANDLPVNAR